MGIMLLRTVTKNLSSTIKVCAKYSSFNEVLIPKLTLPEYLFTNCSKYGNYKAIECALTGKSYTYDDLLTKSKNLSKSLRRHLKLQQGEVVALCLPNIPEYPISVLGVMHAGLTVTTVNPMYTPGEINRQLHDSFTRAVITTTDLYHNIYQTIHKLPILTVRNDQNQSLPEGSIDFEEFLTSRESVEAESSTTWENVAFLPYSSGTTGSPKGVQLTHHNIVANLFQMSFPDVLFIKEPTKSHQDVVPAVAPMCHIFGFFMNTFFVLSRGGLIVTLPKFTSKDYISVLRKYKPDVLMLATPGVLFLTQHPMVKEEDLSSVKVLFTGGARLSPLEGERFLEKTKENIHLLQGYGLTETLTVATNTIKFNVNGSIGRPIPGTRIKVVSPENPKISLDVNCSGELLIKGPQVMKCYLNRTEDTKNAFHGEWFKTGDIGYYDENGTFFLTDRIKELIKVKGFQVAPSELEELIKTFPNIEDVAVVGVPFENIGEAPRAYIVAKKNKKVNVGELQEFVKSQVAPYKELRGGVVLVDSIPKSASGKVLRKELKMDFIKSMEGK